LRRQSRRSSRADACRAAGPQSGPITWKPSRSAAAAWARSNVTNSRLSGLSSAATTAPPIRSAAAARSGWAKLSRRPGLRATSTGERGEQLDSRERPDDNVRIVAELAAPRPEIAVQRRTGERVPTCPRTSPAARSLLQQIPQDTAPKPRGPVSGQPLGLAPAAAADKAAALEARETLTPFAGPGRGARERHELATGRSRSSTSTEPPPRTCSR